MILDKLLEKKDLLIYIDCRIDHLKERKKKVVESVPARERELTSQRFRGRILELQYLKKHIVDLKDTAKRYWLDCARRSM